MIETDIVLGSALKLTCPRQELIDKVSVVARAVSTRGAVQILGGILLRAEEGTLTLAATDMELSLRSSLSASVESGGAAVVPGRVLFDIVRQLPSQATDVTLSYQSGEHALELVCGSANYRLHTFSAEDFPRLPTHESAESFTVERATFLETVARVSRAASRDESRPVLTGILVRFASGSVVMAATDSYRLSVKETTIGGTLPDLEAIIPARALSELGRLATSGETIDVGVQDNQVVFSTEGAILTTRRIDGQFPNYKQLLPETFEVELPLPKGELLEIVRRVSVMAQRNSPLRLRFAEGELTVSAQTQDVGEARESLPIGFSGEPLEIGFNAEFLRDGVESIDADELTLKLISPLRPAVLTGGPDDPTYLLMPIRLAG
jgi:DNA polymerase-3 subunit beta